MMQIELENEKTAKNLRYPLSDISKKYTNLMNFDTSAL